MIEARLRQLIEWHVRGMYPDAEIVVRRAEMCEDGVIRAAVDVRMPVDPKVEIVITKVPLDG